VFDRLSVHLVVSVPSIHALKLSRYLCIGNIRAPAPKHRHNRKCMYSLFHRQGSEQWTRTSCRVTLRLPCVARVPVSNNWDTCEMGRVSSMSSVGDRYPYPPSIQRCSCPVRDNYSRTFALRCSCRSQWRGHVWIALAMLLRCCVVTNTSSVYPPAVSPLAVSNDSEVGHAGTGLPQSQLLVPRPSPSSPDVEDRELLDTDDHGDAEASNRRNWNATTTRTPDALSTDSARRRLIRIRRMLNSGFLCCHFLRPPSTT